MRNVFYSLVVLLLLLLSCTPDDDGSNTIFVEERFSVDVEAIVALPTGSDISFLVDFGQPDGQSAAEAETEVALNEVFLLRSPQGLEPGDQFLYFSLEFFNETGDPIPETDPEGLIVGGLIEGVLPPGFSGITPVEYYDQEYYPSIALRVIDADENTDTNWKYDITCFILRGNGSLFGPYTIDPKLKIKRLN